MMATLPPHMFQVQNIEVRTWAEGENKTPRRIFGT
jgi:hypothetical protein